MQELNEDLKREYFSALYNLQDGHSEPMKRFKDEHPDVFSLINTNYHKRVVIRENLYAMKECNSGGDLVFGTLTFDEEHIEQSDETKRKQATRHLNKFMSAFLFVEEYGEDNNRYHLHFIGLLNQGVEYSEFLLAWHSRAQIEKVISVNKATNYLTDYVSKQAPRIRRNAALIAACRHYHKSKKWSRLGFKESFGNDELELGRICLAMGL